MLQKEFAKIERVVQAKRRPYIPVVLSRPKGEDYQFIGVPLRFDRQVIVWLWLEVVSSI